MEYHAIYGPCRRVADEGLFVLVRFVTRTGLPRTVSVGGREVQELTVGKCALREAM